MTTLYPLGSSSRAIEIDDSNDKSKSQTPGGTSFIDLTREDSAVPHEPLILQSPLLRNKDPSKRPAADSSPRNIQPLKLFKPHFPIWDVHNKRSLSQNAADSVIPVHHLLRHVLQTESDKLQEQDLRSLVNSDIENKLSDVMNKSSQVLRPVGRQGSQTSTENSHITCTTIGANVKALSDTAANGKVLCTQEDPKDATQTATSPTISTVEEALHSVRQHMENNHASTVNILLQRALRRTGELYENVPDFSNEWDPFLGMQTIREPDVEAKDLDTNSKQTSTMNGELNRPTASTPQIPKRSPQFKHYITITRSFLVPDNRKLYFEPYLGQKFGESEASNRRWLKQLREQYEPQEDAGASRQRELTARLTECLPFILELLNISEHDLSSYIIDTGQIILEPTESLLAQLCIKFKTMFGIDIGDVSPDYQRHLKALNRVRGGPHISKELDSIAELLKPRILSCPVCHVNLCGIHGVYETDDSEDEDKEIMEKDDKDYADLNMTYESIMYNHARKLGSSKRVGDSTYNGKPCGAQCFLNRHISLQKSSNWTQDEYTHFKTLYFGMDNEPRAACILAPLMSRLCHDVQTLIRKLNSPSTEYSTKHSRNDSRKSEKLDWYDNIRKTIRVDLDWGRKTDTHLHDKNRQQTGCEHLGVSCFEAGDNCSCNLERILCDKFCACPDDCKFFLSFFTPITQSTELTLVGYMKFTGCNCAEAGSPCSQSSLTCPCVLLNRECDPDLCRACRAAKTVNPFALKPAPLTNSCRNTDIQRGIRKRLRVSESTHPANIGFGAFTAEPVQKGEFIAEYVGEIISITECVRRSELYDKMKMSFIFDLNDEVVIDSYRYGNVERFINHSKKFANCQPVVKLVNGEHRIGFFAMEDLEVGKELFFDYGREFVMKQGLKEMKKGRDSTGEPAKREKKVGKGMRDASSPDSKGVDEDDIMGEDWENMSFVLYGFPDDDDEADEYEEELSQGQIRSSSRPRRNVRKPKRYTR